MGCRKIIYHFQKEKNQYRRVDSTRRSLPLCLRKVLTLGLENKLLRPWRNDLYTKAHCQTQAPSLPEQPGGSLLDVTWVLTHSLTRFMPTLAGSVSLELRCLPASLHWTLGDQLPGSWSTQCLTMTPTRRPPNTHPQPHTVSLPQPKVYPVIILESRDGEGVTIISANVTTGQADTCRRIRLFWI